MTLKLTKSPSADVRMLIRCFAESRVRGSADPSITTRFRYTNRSGRMEEGAERTWEARPG
jgi:hypothetical protein